MSFVASATDRTDLEIAIIGMSGRFSGSRNIFEFWQNLRSGVESITRFSDEELTTAGVDPALLRDPYYVKAGALLEDADKFDAGFFGYSPREAELIDPQQRLFLECAHHALEDAGYDPLKYQGLIGAYAGTTASTYYRNLLAISPETIESLGGFSVQIGNDKDYVATRVSYKLNLQGPSMNIQTACSTSLVAVHVACQSLLSGDCDIALAGGVSIFFPQITGYLYEPDGIAASDGHCRAFDAKASGTIGGKGVGIIVLKRLNDALKDHDFIYALIKGSALNNDGSQKVGFTAPRVDGQAAVIASAQFAAGVDPESITYIETHGTGTELGDPIEIAALTRAFRQRTAKRGFCAVGSLKTNIGHTDAAAGVASMIKTALSLHHKELVPSLNYETPNPKCDFENSPFYVNTALKKWETDRIPRRAGVSSFGIGGTNAHVILEEAPPRGASGPSRRHQLALLSAKTPEALAEASANLAQYLRENPDVNLADVTYTLKVGRTAYARRMCKVCLNAAELTLALEASGGQPLNGVAAAASPPPVVFMFSGAGSQYVNMGRDLYQSETVFRRHLDRCSELLISQLGLDLRKILFPPLEETEAATELLQQIWLTQPATFAVEYALAQLWMHWGLKPWAMIGHSFGEYVAACIANVFSLEDALRLVTVRGKLMQSCAPGAMTAVPLTEKDVKDRLGDRLDLAAVNAPALCVVSGPIRAIEELEQRLEHEGLEARRLRISIAGHSAMMEEILGEFKSTFDTISLSKPALPFISNLTGTWITPEQAVDASYWVSHLRHTVRFSDGIQTLLEDPNRVFLEVGPGQTLAILAGYHTTGPHSHRPLTSMRRADENRADDGALLETLGALWLKGFDIDWDKYYEEEERHRIPLPTYPFQRQRYWIEAVNPQSRSDRASLAAEHKADISEWFYVSSWKRTLPQACKDLEDARCWLIFLDECGLGSAIRNRLEQCGQRVISVSIGQQFGSPADQHYTIRPSHREDYEALLRKLQTLGIVLHKMVHLWMVTPETSEELTSETFQEIQERGFYSLLFLAQSLSTLDISHPVELEVVSSSLHEVTASTECVRAEKATLLGPCKVIPQEMPNVTCRSIDMVADAMDERLVDCLLAEMASVPSDRIVAYRGHHRWVQIFEAVKSDSARPEMRRLRDKGAYLITGGLGEAGLAFAESLAGAVKAKLVLVGRSGLPGREQWQQWLATHHEADAVSRKICRVQAMEELGAEVSIECADVGNEEQLRAVVFRAEKRFGMLHGVIHAAGIFVDAPCQEINTEQCEQQFYAKVKGLFALQKVLQGRSLDFCLLNSSVSSVLGGPGFVAYTAAHLFVEAFALQQNKERSTLWLSIGWDRWLPPDIQGHDAGSARKLAALAISPSEGREVLQRFLSMEGCPQVVVSVSDLDARINRWVKLESMKEAEHVAEDLTTSMHPRPNLSNAYVAPGDPTESALADIWQQLLGLDKVGIHDNFFDLGGHSLLGTQLLSRIRAAFHVQISLRSLYEGPTVAVMAEALSRLQQEQEMREQMELLREIELMADDEVAAELGTSDMPGTGVDSK
jgi:acyl transferase domain-containing protein